MVPARAAVGSPPTNRAVCKRSPCFSQETQPGIPHEKISGWCGLAPGTGAYVVADRSYRGAEKEALHPTSAGSTQWTSARAPLLRCVRDVLRERYAQPAPSD